MTDIFNINPPIFKNNRFFDEFTVAEKSELLAQSQKVIYKKNAIIFKQDQPGDLLYFIEAGHVKLNRVDPSGNELTLAVLGPHEFFGEMAVMDNCGRSASAYALADLTLLAVCRSSFTDLLLKHPQLALQLIATLCSRLRVIDQRMEEIAFGSIKERLKNLLIAENTEKTIQLKQTHQELAAKVCASRETVTRVLKTLKEEGWCIEKLSKKD
jgi:CRP/FNR family transcriptional regulator, cyclic AMP receptor protein